MENIQVTAHERQRAWLETDQPNTTYRLSLELDHLYGDLRDDRKGDLGQPFVRNHPGRPE